MSLQQKMWPIPTLHASSLQDWSLLLMKGKDRHSFLSGITTNTVKGLAVGDANRSLLLTVKGRIVSEFLLVELGEALGLWIPSAVFETFVQTLDRYLILEDVTLEPQPNSGSSRFLVGSELESWLTTKGQALPEAGKGGKLALSDEHSLPFSRLTVAGEVPVLFLWNLDDFELTAWLEQEGIPALDDEGLAALTLIGGWLDSVSELEGLLVHEAELEHTHVNFTKGCFLGQEVVARTHYRGRARKSYAIFTLPEHSEEVSTEGIICDENGRAQAEIKKTFSLGESLYLRALVKDAALENETELYYQREENSDPLPLSLVEWKWKSV